MFSRMLVVAAVFFICSSLAGAEVYQWVDKNGAVTYKDTPPPPSKKRKKPVKVYSDDDPTLFANSQGSSTQHGSATRTAAASNPTASTAKSRRFTGTVEIYVTDWCPYCKAAERYMTSKGIPFVAYDIEKDSAAERRHRELGGRGVPLIVIGSHKMSGFSPKGLEYYLNNSE